MDTMIKPYNDLVIKEKQTKKKSTEAQNNCNFIFKYDLKVWRLVCYF